MAPVGRLLNNIQKHLMAGLLGWLTGTLAEAGVEVPASLDAEGLFVLLMQVLGLTYQSLRARVARRLGEPAVAAMEQAVGLLRTIKERGVGALWEEVKGQVGDLKEKVLGPIKDFLIQEVIQAGVLWVMSLFTPASAFIKACKAIYDIAVFFIERAKQIMALVDAVLDSLEAVADGAVDVMAQKIEDALAKAVPVVIGLLASLLGLGGVAGKVRNLLMKLRAPIEKAIDWVLGKIVEAGKKLYGAAKGRVTKRGEPKEQEKKRREEPKREDAKDDNAQRAQLKRIEEKVPFKGGGESHTLFIEVKGKKATVMVATTPTELDTWLNNMKKEHSKDDEIKQLVEEALHLSKSADDNADDALYTAHARSNTSGPNEDSDINDLVKDKKNLAKTLHDLLEKAATKHDYITWNHFLRNFKSTRDKLQITRDKEIYDWEYWVDRINEDIESAEEEESINQNKDKQKKIDNTKKELTKHIGEGKIRTNRFNTTIKDTPEKRTDKDPNNKRQIAEGIAEDVTQKLKIIADNFEREFGILTSGEGFSAKGRAHEMKGVRIDKRTDTTTPGGANKSNIDITKLQGDEATVRHFIDSFTLGPKDSKQSEQIGHQHSISGKQPLKAKETAGPATIMGKDKNYHNDKTKDDLLSEVEKGMDAPKGSSGSWTSAPRYKDRGQGQQTAMNKTNATGYAWLAGLNWEESRWEWLHIRAASLGGPTDSTNLVVGTRDANTHMIPFESNLRRLTGIVDENKDRYKGLAFKFEFSGAATPARHKVTKINISWRMEAKPSNYPPPTTEGEAAFDPTHTESSLSKVEVDWIEDRLKEERRRIQPNKPNKRPREDPANTVESSMSTLTISNKRTKRR
ncbi:hypothetical protein BE21_55520 [Sorangium cellulosum]|uniref:Uncharacterized protein n=1 Tax=Sorangium cellulosum TaxID=56 RepID=A0A150TBE2_SORCE|nr:hypothetical protein BE21_55520 [Sorangium cellulosum]